VRRNKKLLESLTGQVWTQVWAVTKRGIAGYIDMAGNEDDKDMARAQKAYEAAASSTSGKGASVKNAAGKGKAPSPAAKAQLAPAPKGQPVAAAKTKAPVKAKPSANPKPAEEKPPVSSKPVEEKPSAAPTEKPAEQKPVAAEATTAQAAPIAPAEAAPAAPVEAAPVAAAPVKEAPAKKTPVATKKPEIKAAPKTAHATTPTFAGLFPNFLLEEKTMDMSANINGIQEAMTEAQAKAKAAFEKSTAMLGEVTDFTKGNVEAVMESGKILAEGMQGIGSELVAEGRATFETMSGDIKELAGAKSPTDFFKIQGDMMRKNFDSAVAYGAKNSETMLKLMSDAVAPISGRVSVAMDKVRQTSF
jgi:hypothetical protein